MGFAHHQAIIVHPFIIAQHSMAIRRRTLIVGATLLAALGEAQDAPNLSANNTFRVLADEAWEELESDAIHFKGNFRLIGPQWSVHADEATVFGSLYEPRRFVADGSPALIAVQKSRSKGHITGRGDHIEYLRSDDSVEITGAAAVFDQGHTMTSSMLRWDLLTDAISAGGADGIRMVIDAKKD